MITAITRSIPPTIAQCELSYLSRQRIHYRRAVQQHEAFIGTLERCGAEVVRMAGLAACPDSCFVADTALITDELAILAPLGAESRRGELPDVFHLLFRYREVARLPPDAVFDGGDVLKAGRTLFVARSRRSNWQAFQEIRRMLRPFDYQVVPVALHDCLHLTSAVSVIQEDTLLINPRWVDPEPFSDFRLVTAPPEEDEAASTLRVGDTLLVAEGYPRTRELLQKHHERVEAVDISELQKAESGLAGLCLFV